MSVKIVFSPDGGKLYGAQIVGYEGVDKRIDVIAAILRYGGTIYGFQEVYNLSGGYKTCEHAT